MRKKRHTEQELLENLNAYGAHANELAEPLSHESEPTEKVKSSVKKFERPADTVAAPQEWGVFDGEGEPEEFTEDSGKER